MKVSLEQARILRSPNPDITGTALQKSLPYFRTAMGVYLHRVRSGQLHFWEGRYKHVSLRFWCGMIGHASADPSKPGGRFFAEAIPSDVICATCEGRAIGAGMDDSHKINGRTVKYSPRLK